MRDAEMIFFSDPIGIYKYDYKVIYIGKEDEMKIEIFGTGCPKCKKLEENAAQAAREAGVQAEIVKVTALAEIMKRGVMFTPALAIDGIVKGTGRVLSVEEIKSLLKRED